MGKIYNSQYGGSCVGRVEGPQSDGAALLLLL